MNNNEHEARDAQLELTRIQLFGRDLQTQRERQNLTLNEIAQATRIPLKMLEAIEKGDMESLPQKVFSKGYVQAFVDYLKLDESEWLERFESCSRRFYDGSQSISIPPAVRGQERQREKLRATFAILLLIALAFTVIYFLLQPRERKRPPEFGWLPSHVNFT